MWGRVRIIFFRKNIVKIGGTGMRQGIKFSVGILVLSFLMSLSVFAGDGGKKDMSVEWMYGEEGIKAVSYPLVQWLEDNTVLIYDSTLPAGERVLYRMDPRSLKRVALYDNERALGSLKGILGEDCPEVLPGPGTVDGWGRWAVFNLLNDIFLLDFKSSTFTRATSSEEEAEIGVEFSPDGGKIAYVRGHDLFVYDIEKGKEIRLTEDGSETLLNGELSYLYEEDVFYRKAGIWWSPDSEAVAFLQSDLSTLKTLYYVDFKPHFPRVIPQRYPLTGDALEKARVGIVSLQGGELTWVDLDMERDGFGYVAHVDWLPDSKRLAVQTLNRGQDDLRLYFVSPENGKKRLILEERDDAWVNILDDLYFLKKRSNFIWGSERSGYKHLYLYNNDGTLRNAITAGDWAVRGPTQIGFWYGKSVVHIDEKRGTVYFTSIEKSSLERHLYSIGLNGGNKRRLTKKDGFHSVFFSPNGRYYFDYFSTIASMPEVSLHRRNGKRLATIHRMGEGVEKTFDLQYPEQFTIRAKDGFQLPAQLWKPKDFDPGKKYPVVMYHYGGPQAPVVLNRWNHYTFFNQVLLQEGYLVFTVDIRSSTAISQELAETVLHKMHTDEELRDLLDGVRWLKGQAFVDPDRVGIWGWSYGGASTLLAMTHSKEFKAGIAVAAASDLRYHSSKWSEFAMKSPKDFPEAYEKASLVKHAKDLHGRLLLVHGTYDFNVRIQNAWAFSDALVRAGKPFDMMIYPMRTHGISDAPARIHLFNKMVEFWKLYL